MVFFVEVLLIFVPTYCDGFRSNEIVGKFLQGFLWLDLSVLTLCY